MRSSLLAAVALFATTASGATLQEIRERGRLRVAVYTEFAPFSSDAGGIDVDVAEALARKLGLAAELLPFKDGDSVDDDLRNMIWKGHYLWKGRLADAMLHVPVDGDLARKNEQVRIVASYFREQLVVARNAQRIPQLPTLAAFDSEKVGVQFGTVEDNYLLRAFGGLLRDNVVHYAGVLEATQALRKGEVAAVMGRRTHIEAGLAAAPAKFPVATVPTPGLQPTAWDIGVGVKADDPLLAAAIDSAIADLRRDGTIPRIFAARGVTYLTPAGGP